MRALCVWMLYYVSNSYRFANGGAKISFFMEIIFFFSLCYLHTFIPRPQGAFQ